MRGVTTEIVDVVVVTATKEMVTNEKTVMGLRVRVVRVPNSGEEDSIGAVDNFNVTELRTEMPLVVLDREIGVFKN